MKAIFTNNAISNLSVPVAVTDMEIFVDDLSKFPTPIVGEEYFMATLVGNCDDRVEIVRVVANTGGSLRLDMRGAESTEVQVFNIGDGVFHAMTAGLTEEIIGMWQWYLGPHLLPPINDGQGYPLVPGHLYYQLPVPPQTTGKMFVWDGSEWRPFSPTIAGVQVAAYTWLINTDQNGPYTLPWPDSYGQNPKDFLPEEDVVNVFLNGSKLIEQLPGTQPISGDYTVDYDNDNITMLFDTQTNDMVEAVLTRRTDSDSFDYIQRDEVDASGFGFVAKDGDTIISPENMLPTVERMETDIAFAAETAGGDKMKWLGNWIQQTYNPFEVVRDGPWLAVCTAPTEDRPTPEEDGEPEYALPDAPVYVVQNDLGEVESGHNYTFIESGVVSQVRVFVPNSTDHLFKIQLLNTEGIPGIIYETETTALSLNKWNVISVPKIVVIPGTKIRCQIVMSNTAVEVPANGPVEYNMEAGYWNAGVMPSWATIGGHLKIGGVDQSAVGADAFGCEMQFQKAIVSSSWDIMSHSGSGGSSGGGVGGGTQHIVSNDLPDNSQGSNGTIWMQRVNPI